jgi:hypothetical protein
MAAGPTHKHMPTLHPPQHFQDIGDFGANPLNPAERENRERFALLWKPVTRALKTRGWREFHPGAVVELYVSDGTSKVLSRIWLSPTRGEFRVRLDFSSPEAYRLTLSRKKSLEPFRATTRTRVTHEQLKRKSGMVYVIEVRARLEDVLGSALSSGEMARCISLFVTSVVDAAEEVGVPRT